jgi:hypothetical protein
MEKWDEQSEALFRKAIRTLTGKQARIALLYLVGMVDKEQLDKALIIADTYQD